MTFDWPYYDLINGLLYVHGLPLLAFKDAPRFLDTVQAEAWLVEKDIRGSVCGRED